jgi:hypothetical protein
VVDDVVNAEAVKAVDISADATKRCLKVAAGIGGSIGQQGLGLTAPRNGAGA